MSLTGTRLGHYDVTALIGEGSLERLALGERGAGDDSSRYGRYADRPMGLAPGTRLDHYDVTTLLGEGGMGQPGRPSTSSSTAMSR